MKEYRPRFSPISTDSRRKRAPCLLSLRKAETGVSRSAGISRTVGFRSSLIVVMASCSVRDNKKTRKGYWRVLANLWGKDRCKPASAGIPVPGVPGSESLHEAPDCSDHGAEVNHNERWTERSGACGGGLRSRSPQE